MTINRGTNRMTTKDVRILSGNSRPTKRRAEPVSELGREVLTKDAAESPSLL